MYAHGGKGSSLPSGHGLADGATGALAALSETGPEPVGAGAGSSADAVEGAGARSDGPSAGRSQPALSAAPETTTA